MTALPILLAKHFAGSADCQSASLDSSTKKDPGSAGGSPASSSSYEDIAGFCKTVKFKEIQKHDYVLTPGRYVGAEEEEDDGIPFSEKMATLTAELKEQFVESARLEAEIKKNLAGIGYEC